MSSLKEFPFEKARRITTKEVLMARRAIEKKLGIKRPKRIGRPPKLKGKYHFISIRLHPKIILWAKRQARKHHVGYQTIINEELLKKVA